MVGVDVAVDGADLDAQHALEWDAQRIQHGHVKPALPGRGGNLGADPPGPDHDHRPAAVEPFAQRIGVLDAAQIQNAVQLSAGHCESPRLRACRKQQAVVAQPLVVVERQLAAGRVQADGPAFELQLDVLLGVEARVVDVDLVHPRLAAQVVLGQWRTFVRSFRLGADEHDAPLEALGAQSLCRLGAGHARAHDHMRLFTAHGMPSPAP